MVVRNGEQNTNRGYKGSVSWGLFMFNRSRGQERAGRGRGLHLHSWSNSSPWGKAAITQWMGTSLPLERRVNH